jgi:predicted ribonuclease YlaK
MDSSRRLDSASNRTALTVTVERQQRRAELALPTIGVIEQPYTAQVTQQLLSGHEQQVVILDGRAGSGKSKVATEAVSELASRAGMLPCCG